MGRRLTFNACFRTFAVALAALFVGTVPLRAMPFHDVYIMLDNSGSLGQANFDAQKQAAIDLINDYGGNPNNPMRFAVIEFATNATEIHSFADPLDPSARLDPQDPADVLATLNTLSYSGGYTNTPDALELMLDGFNNFYHTGTTQTAILFTDGQPYGPSGPLDVCQYAAPIKSQGIEVNIVGHGTGWVDQNGQGKTDCLVTDVSNILSKPSPLEYDINDYTYLSATTLVAMAEPGSLAVLGLGLMAMGFARRRAA